MHRRSSRALVVGVVSALSLSACASSGDTASPDPSSSASETSSSASGSSTPSSSSTSTSAEEAKVDGPEDKQLTLKEAKAALPKLSQLPKGYTKNSVSSSVKGDEDGSEVMGTDPKRCAALLFRDQKSTDRFNEHMAAKAHTGYALPEGEELLGEISVNVVSYDEPYPLTLFDRAESALSKCATFTTNDLEITTQAMPAPDLGDRAYAFRLEYAGVGQSRDFLFVRSGHNIVRLFAKSNLPDYEKSQMKDIASTVLDNLEKSAG